MIEVDRLSLEAAKLPQLKNLIVTMGGEPSQPSEKKDQLIDRILFEAAKEPRPVTQEAEKDTPLPELPKATPGACTIEQVLEAVNPYILRGLKVYYMAATETDKESWLFQVEGRSYRVRDTNTGEWKQVKRMLEDSGTLHQPLSVIKRCAGALMARAVPQNAKEEEVKKISDKYIAVA